ncbi:MAG: TIR domain-containing protein [Rubrivivax sp.]
MRLSLMSVQGLPAEDIFISYSRGDGSPYLRGLEAALSEAGFTCFTDRLGTDAHPVLPNALLEQIRACRTLVLVATPGAIARPELIAEEVRTFAQANGTARIVAISFDRGCELQDWRDLPWHAQIVGKARERESLTAIETGQPSSDVVAAISVVSNYMKAKDRLRQIRDRAVVAFAVISAAVVGLSVWGAWKALEVAETTTALSKAKDEVGLTTGALRSATTQLAAASAAVTSQSEIAARLRGENTLLEAQKKGVESILRTAMASARQLLDANRDLEAQNLAKAASLRVMDSGIDFQRKELVEALRDTSDALSLSYEAKLLTENVLKSLAKSLQSASAVQVYLSDNALQAIALSADAAWALDSAGSLLQGRLGCSARTARGGITDDLRDPRISRANLSRLSDALADFSEATAASLTPSAIYLGFRDGSARSIRWWPASGAASVIEVEQWKPHGEAIRYLFETPSGIVSISSEPGNPRAATYALTPLSKKPLTGTRWQIQSPSPIVTSAVAPGAGAVFAVIHQDGSVRLFPTRPYRGIDDRTNSPVKGTTLALPAARAKRRAVAFHPTEPLIAVAHNAAEVQVYSFDGLLKGKADAPDMLFPVTRVETRRSGFYGEARALAWSPDGVRMAVADESSVLVLELRDSGDDLALTLHAPPVRDLRWIDSTHLVSLDSNTQDGGSITLWDIDRLRALEPALAQLRSFPVGDSPSPWKLEPESPRTKAAAQLLGTVQTLLKTTITPLQQCPH